MIDKIIQKLSETGFPDFEFFFREETLKSAPETLEYLLKEEQKKFADLLQKENESITFDDLQEESLLDYFWSLINHFESTDSSDTLRKIIEDFMPKLQDFGNEVAYSKPYFEKLVFLRENADLDTEQIRISDLSIKAYKDRGIDLETEKQEKIKEINKRLGELSETFGNNIVDAKKEFEYIIEDFDIIKELPEDVLEKTKKAYEEKYGTEKKAYLFDADPTSSGAIMQYCSDATVRADFEKAGYTTASSGKYDNRAVVLEILQLKEQKAQILGFKNFAELSLNSKMANSPEQVFELIEGILEKAKLKALGEIEELKKYFSLEKLESYDVAYYSRKYKEEKYKVDDKEVKKYFEYETVLQYLFDFIKKFYGVEIKEIEAKVYNENVKVYEIWKEGKLISYYFLDAFYRPGKRPGAWANYMRSKEYIPNKKVPVILNVCNFLGNENGKTTLYKRDVETIFHEFGHAIHVMFSESKYSSLSGFNVERDFVELPSQLLENWVGEKESLVKLAKHVETGENIPAELLQKFEDLKTYMTGNFAVRQNEFALLDMILHSEEAPKSVEELDQKTLETVNKYGIRKREADYKMYASFGHIFGGGYAAGYYSYMWAEILEADVFARVKEMGMFDPKTGDKLLKTIIGQGTRKDANELFFDFMGREVSNEAFMERYGI